MSDKEQSVLSAKLDKEVEFGYKSIDQALAEFESNYVPNTSYQFDTTPVPEVSDYQMDYLGGNLENLWESFKSGTKRVLGTVAQTPSALAEGAIDMYYGDQQPIGFMAGYTDALKQQTDAIQDWSKSSEDRVNRQGQQRLTENIIAPAFDRASQQWENDKLGAIGTYSKAILDSIIQEPAAALELFVESAPNMIAASNPIGAAVLTSGYFTEYADEAREEFKKVHDREPTSEEQARMVPYLAAAAGLEITGDKLLGKAAKHALTGLIRGSGGVSTTAKGIGLGTTEIGLEGAQEAGTEALQQAATHLPEERFDFTKEEKKQIFESGVLGSAAASPVGGTEIVKAPIEGIKQTRDFKKATEAVENFKEANPNLSIPETDKTPTEAYRALEQASRNVTEENIEEVTNKANELVNSILSNPIGNIKAIAKGLDKIVSDNELEIEHQDLIDDILDKKPSDILVEGVKDTANLGAKGIVAGIKSIGDYITNGKDPLKKIKKDITAKMDSLYDIEDLNERAKQAEIVTAALKKERISTSTADTAKEELLDELITEAEYIESQISKDIIRKNKGVLPDTSEEKVSRAISNLSNKTSTDREADKTAVIDSISLGSFPINEEEVDRLLTNTEQDTDGTFIEQLTNYKEALKYKDVVSEVKSGTDNYWKGYETSLQEFNAYLNSDNKTLTEQSLTKLKNFTDYQRLKFNAISDVLSFNSNPSKNIPNTLTDVKLNEEGLITKFKVANPYGFTKGRNKEQHTFYFDTPGKLKALSGLVNNEFKLMSPLLKNAEIQFNNKFKQATEARIQPSEETSQPTPSVSTTETIEAAVQPSTQFINHSGGAKGSDTSWGEIGEQFGVISNHYYKDKTPKGNIQITEEQFQEGLIKAQQAAKDLKRNWSNKPYVQGLLSRNWQQVKNADSIFAIGEREGKYAKGGTGYAVAMAIAENKPVYLFDQVANQWFKSDNDTWIEVDTPTLTPNFAGIGTRNITDTGITAIQEVYNNTFESKDTDQQVQKETTTKEQVQTVKLDGLDLNPILAVSQLDTIIDNLQNMCK